MADQPTSLEDAVIAEMNVDAVNLFSKTSTRLPVTADIAAETLKDHHQLEEVFQCVKTGKWPKKPNNQLPRFNSMRKISEHEMLFVLEPECQKGRRKNQGRGLQKFLFNYRRTPCSTLSGQSPADVFLRRRLRSTLTLLKPSEPTIGLRRNQKMEAQFNKHHAARSKMFEPDDLVWARDYRAGYPRWTKGRIRIRHGQCTYDVECPSAEKPTQDQDIESNENQLPTQIDDEPTADNRQSRTRRPPVRLQIDPRKKTYTASVHLGREVLDPYSDMIN
ncbi:hypothetical protein OSTOST_04926 [Ostertagia ostertagi]